MGEPKRRLKIKEWGLELGIKVLDPKGFTNWNGKSRLLTNKYTKAQFKNGIKKSIITVKNEKGLDFYNDINIDEDEVWKSQKRYWGQRREKDGYFKSKTRRNS